MDPSTDHTQGKSLSRRSSLCGGNSENRLGGGKTKRLEISPGSDVVRIEIPVQNCLGLPGLDVEVNGDAVLVSAKNGVLLGNMKYNELVR